MASVRFSFSSARTGEQLRKLAAGLTPQKADAVVKTAAWKTHAQLVLRTPKKWTGGTRRGWQVKRVRGGVYECVNKTKVMRFLEFGTAAHGPVRAKMLFIPLNRRTALAAASRGVRAVVGNTKTIGERVEAFVRRVRGQKKKTNRPFKYGRDYIFKRWVRGIAGRHIVENFKPKAEAILKNEMAKTVNFLVR